MQVNHVHASLTVSAAVLFHALFTSIIFLHSIKTEELLHLPQLALTVSPLPLPSVSIVSMFITIRVAAGTETSDSLLV